MSKARKAAVAALLLVSSACVPFPLYYEEVPVGSGPPATTFWSGLIRSSDFRETTVVVPGFWTFSALSLSGMAWAIIGRRGWAVASLALALTGYASLAIGGTRILPGAFKAVPPWPFSLRSGPLDAFYVAVVAIALPLAILLFAPKEPARVDPA